MPIGKGQRALIVSPPKAGKTTIMQDIANAITRNNPGMPPDGRAGRRAARRGHRHAAFGQGEVIASTFDRPPSDHTQAAELAIERAKRLVEQGKDVVVLLDSDHPARPRLQQRLPASGRILSGGVDSTALYPPKRFLGAARNIEFGGSLTIIATAMVETGSTGDTVIFEEFSGHRQRRTQARPQDRRAPGVPGGRRQPVRHPPKDELLLSADEFAIVQ